MDQFLRQICALQENTFIHFIFIFFVKVMNLRILRLWQQRKIFNASRKLNFVNKLKGTKGFS